MVFMPIFRRPGSTFTMKEITEEDIFTVGKLKASGMAWTLVQHPPFMDVLGFYVGMKATETGVRVPAGNGKFAPATRDDLAAAHAATLAGKGHEGKTYTLTGSPGVSFPDIAKFLTKLTGREVPYTAISDDEYLKILAPTACRISSLPSSSNGCRAWPPASGKSRATTWKSSSAASPRQQPSISGTSICRRRQRRHRKEAHMKIGIIGAGTVAQTIARHVLPLGHHVMLSNTHGPESLAPLVKQLGPSASAGTPQQAADQDIVVLAVMWWHVQAALFSIPDWKGRVLVDATNRVAGVSPLSIGDVSGRTSSEIVADLAPAQRSSRCSTRCR